MKKFRWLGNWSKFQENETCIAKHRKLFQNQIYFFLTCKIVVLAKFQPTSIKLKKIEYSNFHLANFEN